MRAPKSNFLSLPFALYVRNSDSHPPRLTKLIATAGAADIDAPTPAITVMLPTEH